MRINKYLASCGLGSRRNVEKLIVDGLIVINGHKINDLSYDVSNDDKVEYNGKLVHPVQDKVYIMLNKPKCYIATEFAMSINYRYKIIKEKFDELFKEKRFYVKLVAGNLPCCNGT